jgi:hypothetical protein
MVMKTEKRIPHGISDYIQEHFKEDFLFDVKEVKEIDGHSVYTVEVSKDDYIHTLRFNEEGTLLKEEAEQAFPPDRHEQTFGDVPE